MGLKEDAKQKLQEAYEKALITPDATCRHKDFIDFVIDNTHLTYKYILFTAILSLHFARCLRCKNGLP